MKNLANNKIDFLQFQENHIISTNETVTLYHGSSQSFERCCHGR